MSLAGMNGHLVNAHTTPMPEEEVQQKKLIAPGSPAHVALTEVVLDPRWLKEGQNSSILGRFLNSYYVP